MTDSVATTTEKSSPKQQQIAAPGLTAPASKASPSRAPSNMTVKVKIPATRTEITAKTIEAKTVVKPVRRATPAKVAAKAPSKVATGTIAAKGRPLKKANASEITPSSSSSSAGSNLAAASQSREDVASGSGGKLFRKKKQHLPRESKRTVKVVELTQLNAIPLKDFLVMLDEHQVPYNARLTRSQLVVSYLRKLASKFSLTVEVDGTFELQEGGHHSGTGYLRHTRNSFASSPEDIYITNSIVKKFNLVTGDQIKGLAKPPGNSSKDFMTLTEVETLNGVDPLGASIPEPFEDKLAHFPDELLQLEIGTGGTEDIPGRIIDLISPIGKGQRGLIVSPPKAGKTVLLKCIASAIESKHPDCELIVLLIDERPEEVTDMRLSLKSSEVVASTFDEPASRHVQVAEMVIGRAKRMVEQGKDVIILLDSITRLARAYNTMQPASGKILSGGVDARALERPKRFFGTARNVSGMGSLTILASALVDTGSKMDEVIYEEFKGTGNMEVHLERKIAEKRVFPAINISRSGTRREELLMEDDDMQRVWVLRKLLFGMDSLAAMEFLLERMNESQTNAAFFQAMRKL